MPPKESKIELDVPERSRSEISLDIYILGVEFGYRQAEKGNNIQTAKYNALRIWKGTEGA